MRWRLPSRKSFDKSAHPSTFAESMDRWPLCHPGAPPSGGTSTSKRTFCAATIDSIIVKLSYFIGWPNGETVGARVEGARVEGPRVEGSRVEGARVERGKVEETTIKQLLFFIL